MAKEKKAKSKKSGGPGLGVMLKKHGFWIGWGLVLLIGVICYFLGTSAVDDKYAKAESEFKSIAGKISNVPATAPSKERQAEHVKTLDARHAAVYGVWQKMYDVQQQQVMIWPEKKLGPGGAVIEEGLPADFIAKAKSLPPWERLNGASLGAALEQSFQFDAQQRVITRLCAILKAPVAAADAKAGSAAKADADAEALTGGLLVRWDKASQDATRSFLFLNFPATGAPPTFMVMRTHESACVIGGVFRMLNAMNEAVGADGPHSAAVKRVMEIRIGPEAKALPDAKVYTSAERKDAKTTAASAAAQEEGAEKLSKFLEEEVRPRYVDEHGHPIKTEELKAIAEGKAQFKRIPVTLKVVLDQRHLGLLSYHALASPLKFRIQQMKFVTDPRYDRTRRGTGSDSEQAKTETREKKGFYDMETEVYGWVHVYYPPTQPQAEGEKTDEAATDESAKSAAGG